MNQDNMLVTGVSGWKTICIVHTMVMSVPGALPLDIVRLMIIILLSPCFQVYVSWPEFNNNIIFPMVLKSNLTNYLKLFECNTICYETISLISIEYVDNTA